MEFRDRSFGTSMIGKSQGKAEISHDSAGWVPPKLPSGKNPKVKDASAG
jgi:hypothetical protein